MSEGEAPFYDSFEDYLLCDPELDGECPPPEGLIPMSKDFIAGHFFLWFLTMINAAGPIVYWYVWMKPSLDGNASATARLETNFWWMEMAWPLIVWGHVGLYGFPAFWGIFAWFGIGFFDKVYKFWMDAMMNYFGTFMHFIACLGFLAGSGFWVPNGLYTVLDAWVTAGAYVGWTVITFVWIGLTKPKSIEYMKWKNCEKKNYDKDGCEPPEVVAEEDDDAEEIPEDATTFYWDMFPM